MTPDILPFRQSSRHEPTSGLRSLKSSLRDSGTDSELRRRFFRRFAISRRLPFLRAKPASRDIFRPQSFQIRPQNGYRMVDSAAAASRSSSFSDIPSAALISVTEKPLVRVGALKRRCRLCGSSGNSGNNQAPRFEAPDRQVSNTEITIAGAGHHRNSALVRSFRNSRKIAE